MAQGKPVNLIVIDAFKMEGDHVPRGALLRAVDAELAKELTGAGRTRLAKCWARAKEQTKYEELLARAENYKLGTVPAANLVVGLRNNTTATMLAQTAFNGTSTVGNYSIETYPNGWARISVWATSGISAGNTLGFYWGATGAIPAGQTWYIWGGQIEDDAPSISSYIPTVGATATRAQDVCRTFNGSGVPWANANEGSLVCVFRMVGNSTDGIGGVFSIDDDTTNNRFDYRYDQGLMALTQAGVGDNVGGIGGPSLNTRCKLAQGYGGSVVAKQYRDGALTATTLVVGLHPASLLYLNLGMIGATLFPGLCIIESFTYYPKRLPDAVLQALTA